MFIKESPNDQKYHSPIPLILKHFANRNSGITFYIVWKYIIHVFPKDTENPTTKANDFIRFSWFRSAKKMIELSSSFWKLMIVNNSKENQTSRPSYGTFINVSNDSSLMLITNGLQWRLSSSSPFFWIKIWICLADCTNTSRNKLTISLLSVEFLLI